VRVCVTFQQYVETPSDIHLLCHLLHFFPFSLIFPTLPLTSLTQSLPTADRAEPVLLHHHHRPGCGGHSTVWVVDMATSAQLGCTFVCACVYMCVCVLLTDLRCLKCINLNGCPQLSEDIFRSLRGNGG